MSHVIIPAVATPAKLKPFRHIALLGPSQRAASMPQRTITPLTAVRAYRRVGQRIAAIAGPFSVSPTGRNDLMATVLPGDDGGRWFDGGAECDRLARFSSA